MAAGTSKRGCTCWTGKSYGNFHKIKQICAVKYHRSATSYRQLCKKSIMFSCKLSIHENINFRGPIPEFFAKTMETYQQSAKVTTILQTIFNNCWIILIENNGKMSLTKRNICELYTKWREPQRLHPVICFCTSNHKIIIVCVLLLHKPQLQHTAVSAEVSSNTMHAYVLI